MATNGLEVIPDGSAVFTRLGDLLRAHRLLKRQHRLSRKNAGNPLMPAERKVLTRLREIEAECRELRLQLKLSMEAREEADRQNTHKAKGPADG